MLTRGEDYAHQQPSLTKKKLRQLEITAGAPEEQRSRRDLSTNRAIRDAERQLRRAGGGVLQADGHRPKAAGSARKVGASATPERA